LKVCCTPVFFTSVDLETYKLTQRGVEAPSPREREHLGWLASLVAPFGTAPRPA
jgi:hypothetical protein